MGSVRCEVVVVGAGPAGGHAARRLAERGHEVVLVDENPGPRCTIVCSGIVGVEAYERFDLPPGAIVDTLHWARFVSPGGVEVLHHPDRPLAHVVDRTRFDEHFTRAAAGAGVVLLRGHRARSVQSLRDAVEVVAQTADGTRLVRAKALVLATGFRARLHPLAGLGQPCRYVRGLHLQLPMESVHAAEVFFGRQVAPGFFAWAVPYGPGRARLGLLSGRGGRALLERFVRSPRLQARSAAAIGRRHEPVEDACTDERVLSRGIVQGPVVPSVADRVIAVGEAAGQVKTTTGGGLYYGLIGAELGAEVLSGAVRTNRLGRGDLQRYHELWMHELGPEIRTGFRMQRLGAALDDPQIDLLFRTLQGAVGRRLAGRIRFDWHRPFLNPLFAAPWMRWLSRTTTTARQA
jgi:geranylgeranyl reductase family protein